MSTSTNVHGTKSMKISHHTIAEKDTWWLTFEFFGGDKRPIHTVTVFDLTAEDLLTAAVRIKDLTE